MAFLDNMKTTVDLLRNLDNMELRTQLQAQLLEIQNHCLQQSDQIRSLTEENAHLKQQLSLAEDFYFEHSVYWRRTSDDSADGPYCPKCHPAHQRAVRMGAAPDDSYWRCAACNFNMLKPGCKPHGRTMHRTNIQ